jgi:formate C-acetyltransferase
VTDRLYQYVLGKEHKKFRKHLDVSFNADMSAIERMTFRFERMAEAEVPHILPDEKICFIRTVENHCDIYTQTEWDNIKENHFIHELGYLSNVCPNYERVIADGLEKSKEYADEYGVRCINAILDLAQRYKNEAEKQGRDDLVDVLSRVPALGATTFHEALQMMRIIHYSLWLEGNYHNTLGRFDQYLYPYLKADLESGRLTKQEAFELLCDFFLSFNKDSDLYVGVQQGDNGQSMVLGGMDKEGNDSFNLLSEMCLEASGRLLMIDPKINLRVSKKTPLDVLKKASKLTKAGLGFPQYSNDDVVIDALIKMGYEPQDARNYVVAACWEFIIPGCGADIANIGALSFPRVIDNVLHSDLEASDTYEEFVACINREINKQASAICNSIQSVWFVPSPFANVCMDGGIYEGAKYNNFGIHGTGIATATDSVYAIKKYIFDEKRFDKAAFIRAIDEDFVNDPALLALLRHETDKMGYDNDEVDEISVRLLHMFADALDGKTNCRGGVFRAGTGSAMYYLWHADEIGASPDGRRRGEPFGTNFSASIFAKIPGPFSVVKSFTKQPFDRVCNGGPLTMEFASSMFDDSDSIRKIAILVKSFVDLGGHQLQLNAVNLEKLKDAKLHPENHRQLVVRIWGWSAYFVELDEKFQNHVMLRQEYSL